jgi:hypothetical protein
MCVCVWWVNLLKTNDILFSRWGFSIVTDLQNPRAPLRCQTKEEFGREWQNRRALSSLTSITEAHSLIKRDMSTLMRTAVAINFCNLAFNVVSILQVFWHKRACCSYSSMEQDLLKSIKYPNFKESKGSLQPSQKLDKGPYYKQHESSEFRHIYFLNIHFNIIFTVYPPCPS